MLRCGKIGAIAVTTVSVLAAGAIAASPATASTDTCGLISHAALARAVGLPHVATESIAFPRPPGGVGGSCQIRAWSGAKPGGTLPKLSKCFGSPGPRESTCVFDKQQTARLINGTLAYVFISTEAEDPSSPAAYSWRYYFYGSLPELTAGPKITGQESTRNVKPPTLGGASGGYEGGRRVRYADGYWLNKGYVLSNSKYDAIRLAVFASAKKKPGLLLNRIATIAVPAFGV